MFTKICLENREAIYGLLSRRNTAPDQVSSSTGSAFAVAPGILVTAAHCVFDQSDPAHPPFSDFLVIRAPDVGRPHEVASLVAFDEGTDLAILKISSPRSQAFLRLADRPAFVGEHCGALGFPLSGVEATPSGLLHTLIERFQSAAVCACLTEGTQTLYETDSPMYPGSSGCPGFLPDGTVFGMHNRSLLHGRDSHRTCISRWVPAATIRKYLTAHDVLLSEAA